MKTAVVGCGKLGQCLALLLAEAGHDVIGVDTNPEHLAMLRAGEPTHHERDLDTMLAEHGPKIDWRSDPADAAAAEVSFIVVPTPSLASGAFDVSIVIGAVEAIGSAVEPDHTFVLCVVSTTNPGDCAGPIRDALERSAGRLVDGTLGLAFQPEFVALGDVFEGMRSPDLLLIGESDKWAGDVVSEVMRSIERRNPDLDVAGRVIIGPTHSASEHRLTLTEAEIAKLSVNAFVTQKISYANTLGELCEGYGARGELVARAVGADSRIGYSYLRPGRAYGGPCFPRDGRAFREAGRMIGLDLPLSEATDAVNRRQAARLGTLVVNAAAPPAKIAVLGLAYKPGTADLTESFGVGLAERLSYAYAVVGYDPTGACPPNGVMCALTLADAVEGADVVVLANDDPAFKGPFPGAVIIDCMGAAVDLTGCARYIRAGDGTTM